MSGGCLQSIGNGGRDGRQSPEVAMFAKCLTHVCRTGTGRTGRTEKTAYLILWSTWAVASREREKLDLEAGTESCSELKSLQEMISLLPWKWGCIQRKTQQVICYKAWIRLDNWN